MSKQIDKLVSPCCKSSVKNIKSVIICERCKKEYPNINGIPILIDEDKSVFSQIKISETSSITHKESNRNRLFNYIKPSPTFNAGAKRRFLSLKRLLEESGKRRKILIVGGAVIGAGLKAFLNSDQFDIVETDAAIGPRTQLVCDAHDIPFPDGYFDAVIIQAVLEHVLDPYRCVSEVYRILNSEGFVYAETPFMQQVHEGSHDFQRFTMTGHRRLFNNFIEIDSGAIGGPGSVLAWSIEYLAASFAWDRYSWRLFKGVSRFLGVWFKYLDFIAPKRRGIYDSASGFFFLGKKSDQVISDLEILNTYRGFQ